MKDVTRNPGILPIKMGNAKLTSTEHTFIHYYKTDGLVKEFYKLKIKNEQLIKKLSENVNIISELDEYIKITNYTVELIEEKLNNIIIINPRYRRGLINGLGSVIKAITGNLDNTDSEKYDRLLKQISKNQITLQDQLDSQFSINSQIIDEFNQNVKIIQFNQKEIHDKFIEINNVIRNNSLRIDVGAAREVVNHLQIVFNLILHIVQEIENSLTFCKTGTLHPSIISTKQLYQEIKKIEKYYIGKLPLEIKYENMLEFESLIKVNCKVHPDEIIYFLTLPITNSKEFDLYYLRPIPTKVENGFASILPETFYLLKAKDNSTVKPLKGICTIGTTYLCPTQLLSTYNSFCEKRILQGETPKDCVYVKLEIQDNTIEYISEINQYLGVFISDEKIELRTEKETEVKTLNGIYLIDDKDKAVYFRNEQLITSSNSKGQPKIITNVKVDMEINHEPDFKIDLKEINLNGVKLNRMRRIQTFDTSHLIVPSFWTIILYVILIICFVYFVYNVVKRSKTMHLDTSKIRESKTIIDINLPGDAKI